MATSLGSVQWAAFLKELYPDGLPFDIMARRHTFLSMVAKQGDAFGDHVVVPVTYDLPSGRSAGMAALLGATGPIGPTRSAKFNVFLA